jgi:hypothetical protein
MTTATAQDSKTVRIAFPFMSFEYHEEAPEATADELRAKAEKEFDITFDENNDDNILYATGKESNIHDWYDTTTVNGTELELPGLHTYDLDNPSEGEPYYA